jgi:hypothetical protein
MAAIAKKGLVAPGGAGVGIDPELLAFGPCRPDFFVVDVGCGKDTHVVGGDLHTAITGDAGCRLGPGSTGSSNKGLATTNIPASRTAVLVAPIVRHRQGRRASLGMGIGETCGVCTAPASGSAVERSSTSPLEVTVAQRERHASGSSPRAWTNASVTGQVGRRFPFSASERTVRP